MLIFLKGRDLPLQKKPRMAGFGRLSTNLLSESLLLHALVLPVEANPVADNRKRGLFNPLSGFHINDVTFIHTISFNLSARHERPSFHSRRMYDRIMIVHNLCIVNNI